MNEEQSQINTGANIVDRNDQRLRDFVQDVLPGKMASQQIAQWAREQGWVFTTGAIKLIRMTQVEWLIRQRQSADEVLKLAKQEGIEVTKQMMERIKSHYEHVARKSLAFRVYYGSHGAATRKFCSALEKKSHLGRIAAQLFRTQKASARAKVYRGGFSTGQGYRVSYRDVAYERKGECMSKLCELLMADNCGLTWGWGHDASTSFARHVLYVELPQGQVSFHSNERYVGPDYGKKWDGQEESERRILEFCRSVMEQA